MGLVIGVVLPGILAKILGGFISCCVSCCRSDSCRVLILLSVLGIESYVLAGTNPEHVTLCTLTFPRFLSLNLRSQKACSLPSIPSIRQVCGRNDQRARAHHVSGGTEHFDLVLGVVGDLPVVLQVASKAEEHDPFDFGLDVAVQFLHGVVDHGTSLTMKPISMTLTRFH